MSLDVLNCALGDLKLSFDKNDPVQLERARRAVTKMLRDGFVIFVEVAGKTRRVEAFDESCDAYVITDVPTVPVSTADPPVSTAEGATNVGTGTEQPSKRGRPSKQRIPAAGAKATAIAPKSGG